MDAPNSKVAILQVNTMTTVVVDGRLLAETYTDYEGDCVGIIYVDALLEPGLHEIAVDALRSLTS